MIFNLMKPIPIAEPTMYLYGHEADKTVTYNGVELPELPEWDKTAYPYALISYNTAGFYSLYCFSTEPSVANKSNQTLVPYSENGYDISATFSENEWGEFGEPKEFVGLLSSVTKGIIWTNFDLRYQGTEDVHFEATDPITTYTNADVTINGVGYVGAVLPKLPEWDKTTYPYAYISYRFGDYILLLFSKEGFIKKGTTIINGVEYETTSLSTESGQDPYMVYSSIEGYSTAWEYSYSNDNGSNGIVAPLWGNTDVYNEDGSVYLKATNPIPVYE